MDSPIPKELDLPLSVPLQATASANRKVLKSTSEVGKKCKGYTPKERFEIGLYASEHDIAAVRSYISILDTFDR